MRAKQVHITPAEEEEIIRLFNEGLNGSDIARRLNRGKGTINKRMKILRNGGRLPAMELAAPLSGEPDLEGDAGFLAALRKYERHPAEQSVQSSSVVRMIHAPALASCVGSPAATCAEG